MDAENSLDRFRQHIGEALDLIYDKSPARGDAVPDTVNDEFADVQPAERREYVKNRFADLRDVGDNGRNCIKQAFAQSLNQVHARHQELGCVVVDDARDIRDDAGQVLDQRRQTVCDALCQVQNKLNAGVYDLADVLTQAAGKICGDGHRLRQQVGDAGFQALAQLGDHLNAGGHQLGQCFAQALHQRTQHRSCYRQNLRCSFHDTIRQLSDDLHAGLHQTGQLLGDAGRQIGDDLSGSGQHGFRPALGQGGGEGTDALDAVVAQIGQRGLHLVVHRQLQSLKSGTQRGHDALQVVLLGLRHLPHGTVSAVDLCGQRVPLFALCCQQAVDGGEVGLVEQLVDDAVLLALRHAVQGPVQVAQNFVQPAHVALRVVDLQPQLLHQLGGIIGRGLEGQDDVAQMGTALRALDAHVCQQTQSGGQLGGAPLQVGCGAAHRQDGFAQL